MDIIVSTILETEWGLIVFGIFMFIAILIGIFNNKPKI